MEADMIGVVSALGWKFRRTRGWDINLFAGGNFVFIYDVEFVNMKEIFTMLSS